MQLRGVFLRSIPAVPLLRLLMFVRNETKEELVLADGEWSRNTTCSNLTGSFQTTCQGLQVSEVLPTQTCRQQIGFGVLLNSLTMMKTREMLWGASAGSHVQSHVQNGYDFYYLFSFWAISCLRQSLKTLNRNTLGWTLSSREARNYWNESSWGYTVRGQKMIILNYKREIWTGYMKKYFKLRMVRPWTRWPWKVFSNPKHSMNI